MKCLLNETSILIGLGKRSKVRDCGRDRTIPVIELKQNEIESNCYAN